MLKVRQYPALMQTCPPTIDPVERLAVYVYLYKNRKMQMWKEVRNFYRLSNGCTAVDVEEEPSSFDTGVWAPRNLLF